MEGENALSYQFAAIYLLIVTPWLWYRESINHSLQQLVFGWMLNMFCIYKDI